MTIKWPQIKMQEQIRMKVNLREGTEVFLIVWLWWTWSWAQRCLASIWLNDWKAVVDSSPRRSHPPYRWHTAECFYLSGGLYRLSNLINKATEICQLFIFPVLPGFARSGKLPFSGTIFPRHCAVFLLSSGRNLIWAQPRESLLSTCKSQERQKKTAGCHSFLFENVLHVQNVYLCA